MFRGALGADFIDGGAGVDTADYREKTGSVEVALSGASDSFVFVGGVVEDTIRNIENVFGGKGNDTLTGDGLANTLNGNDGKDLLTGGGGADILDGGAASDTASYRDKTASVSVTLDGATYTTVTVGGRGRGHDPQRREHLGRDRQRQPERRREREPPFGRRRKRHPLRWCGCGHFSSSTSLSVPRMSTRFWILPPETGSSSRRASSPR
ncbi:calcium-binding protein (plasmid) [Sinorhizobium meliloti]|nr:calcium-binding protein [Sinorhizobium meliloti]